MSNLHRLRGRHAELQTVARALAAAREGRGAVLVIEGPPGFGKTRLLREAATMAAQNGFVVAEAAAPRIGRVAPLDTLMAALDDASLSFADRALFGDLELQPEARYWILDEAEGALETTSSERPLLICLDDLHWADKGTLAALEVLPGRLRDSPVVWMLAFRSGEAEERLHDLSRRLDREGADHLELGLLDDASVGLVVEDMIGGAPTPDLLDVAMRSDGCPFLLVELLMGQREEGLVQLESGTATLVDEGLPRRIEATTRRRLGRLTSDAAVAARAAAVLGPTFSLDEVMAMVGRTATAMIDVIDELLRTELLVEHGDRLGFRHELLRDGIVETLTDLELRTLQRRAVDVLLAKGVAPLEVTTKLAASAQVGDEAAVATLFDAAQTAAVADPSTAADLGQEALRLCLPGDARRSEIVSAVSLWLHASGRVRQGRVFVDSALRETLSPTEEARVRLDIAGIFSLSPDDRVQIGRDALALPGLTDELRAKHLVRLSHNLNVAGRGDEASALADAVQAAVEVAPYDEVLLTTLDLAAATKAYTEDRFASALSHIETAATRGAGRSEAVRTRMEGPWRAELLAMFDDFEGALEVTREGLVSARREGRAWSARTWEGFRGRMLVQTGQLADASAALAGIFGDGDELKLENLIEAAAGFAMGRAAIHMGDARASHAAAAFAEDVYANSWPEMQRHAAWLLTLQAADRGDPGGGRDLLLRGVADGMPILPAQVKDVTDEVRLTRIALACGDAKLAGWAVARAERRARQNPGIASIDGCALHARGLLSRQTSLLRQAVGQLAKSPRRLAYASGLEDLGLSELKDGDERAAVANLSRSLDVSTTVGALADARRVRDVLRTLGVERRIMRRERSDTGWDALTRSEEIVARLVAQGFTNREVADRLIVSPHTVSMHLRRAFAKLEVRSRRDLGPLVPAGD